METDEHHQHKDVYQHSLTVLDQAIAQEQDGPDLTLRLAALLHDIGKPATRRYEDGGGVSFHHHEVVGAKMVRKRLEGAEVPEADDRGRRRSDLPAPALPRLLRRSVDRLRGPSLRHRRRRVVAALAQAGARRLRRPATSAVARHCRRPTTPSKRGSTRSPPPRIWPKVRPDLDGNAIMELLGIRPAPSSAGPGSTSRSSDWSAGRSTATRPNASCWPGRAPKGSRTELVGYVPAHGAMLRPVVEQRGTSVTRHARSLQSAPNGGELRRSSKRGTNASRSREICDGCRVLRHRPPRTRRTRLRVRRSPGSGPGIDHWRRVL